MPGGAQSRSRSGAGTEVVGYVWMAAFAGQSDGGPAVVGDGAGVGAMRQQEFYDSEMAVGGGSEKRCVARAVAVVRVEAVIEEILHDCRMPSSDSSREGVVASAVRSSSVDIGSLVSQVAHRVKMAEKTGERKDRESVLGTRVRGRAGASD